MQSIRLMAMSRGELDAEMRFEFFQGFGIRRVVVNRIFILDDDKGSIGCDSIHRLAHDE